MYIVIDSVTKQAMSAKLSFTEAHLVMQSMNSFSGAYYSVVAA